MQQWAKHPERAFAVRARTDKRGSGRESTTSLSQQQQQPLARGGQLHGELLIQTAKFLHAVSSATLAAPAPRSVSDAVMSVET